MKRRIYHHSHLAGSSDTLAINKHQEVKADSVEKVDGLCFLSGYIELHSCFAQDLDLNLLQCHCEKLNSTKLVTKY